MTLVGVRWLCAFRGGKTEESLQYELSRADGVCFALTSSNHGRAAGRGEIGLLVDLKATYYRRYFGDAWSEYKGGVLCPTRHGRITRKRAQTGDDSQRWHYDECITRGRPVYCGIVVCSNADNRLRSYAKHLAKKYDLPYLGTNGSWLK